MIAKNSFRGMGFGCLLGGLIIIGCCPKSDNVQKDAQGTRSVSQAGSEALIEADCEFASLASDSGLAVSFAAFAADSAVILRDGAHPFVGRETIRTLFSRPSRGQLQWEPYFADISGSGDLGYTLGSYQFTSKDSAGNERVSHGYYVTIWKKQADGRWKYALDTGVGGPEEGN